MTEERKNIVISQSSFKNFLQCKRKFFYRNVEGWVLKNPIIYPAQSFGLETHRFLQGFDRNAYAEDFATTQGKEPTEAEINAAENNFYSNIKPAARATAKHIIKTFNYQPKRVERQSFRPMPKKAYGGFNWFVSGRYDGLIEIDKKDFICDIKTVSDIEENDDWIIFEKREKLNVQPYIYQYVFDLPMQYYCAKQSRSRQKKDEGDNEFELRVSQELETAEVKTTHEFKVESNKEEVEEHLLDMQNEVLFAVKFGAWTQNYNSCKNFFGMCEYCHACFNNKFELYEKTKDRTVMFEHEPIPEPCQKTENKPQEKAKLEELPIPEKIEPVAVVQPQTQIEKPKRLSKEYLKKVIPERIKFLFINNISIKDTPPANYIMPEGDIDFGKQNNQFIGNLIAHTGLDRNTILNKILGEEKNG